MRQVVSRQDNNRDGARANTEIVERREDYTSILLILKIYSQTIKNKDNLTSAPTCI